jgi:outer membrane murein-binding lipoprotein Lpp
VSRSARYWLEFRLVPRFRLVLAVVAAGLVALAGCSSNDKPSTQAQQQPPQQIQETPANVANEKPAAKDEPPTSAQLKNAIGKIILNDGEIGRGVEVQDQDDSLDAPTNDICAKDWASNSTRIARNQDFFWKSAKTAELVVSNEAVAYQPGKGAAAIAEIEKAVGDCDGWKHDQGQIKDVTTVDPPEGALKGSFAWRGVDDRKGEDYSYLAVYQTDGDLLSAIYVWAGSRDEAREIASDLVPKAADRLKAAVG